MKVKLKEHLYYSRLTDLVCMDKSDADEHDYERYLELQNKEY